MRRDSGRIHFVSIAFAVTAAFWLSVAQAQVLVHFDLPAQPLARSLKAIGAATNTDIGFNASQVAALIAPSLKAELTVDDALVLVLTGTGLRPQHLDDHTIVIAATESSQAVTTEGNPSLMKVSALAEVDNQTAPPAETVGDSSDSSSSSNARKNDLEEIVVTGTLIPGAEPASRVSTYTRVDIENQGFGSSGGFHPEPTAELQRWRIRKYGL